jgi:DNA (cytosine-5)-methyltransferase 1
MGAKKSNSVFSFFTGAGFLDAGFADSGFRVAFANECIPEFARGYLHGLRSLGHEPPSYGLHVSSIEHFSSSDGLILLQQLLEKDRRLGHLVGFVGGPPCPDFSVGGKNRGASGDNGKLTRVYFDLIIAAQPDWFVFENVKGLFRTRRHREFFDAMRDAVRAAGYRTDEQLINSIEYGAPQDRDRIIMIGIRDQILPGPQQLELDWRAHRTFERSILTSADWPTRHPFGSRCSKPRGVPEELTVAHWFARNDVVNHPNAPHVFLPRQGLKRFESVDEGDDKKKSYKRLHRHRYSPTACYGNNEVHLHPTLPRRISVAEALALQSLPRAFELPADMTLSAMFKTVGNGVPYLAAVGIAKTVAHMLSGVSR